MFELNPQTWHPSNGSGCHDGGPFSLAFEQHLQTWPCSGGDGHCGGGEVWHSGNTFKTNTKLLN